MEIRLNISAVEEVTMTLEKQGAEEVKAFLRGKGYAISGEKPGAFPNEVECYVSRKGNEVKPEELQALLECERHEVEVHRQP